MKTENRNMMSYGASNAKKWHQTDKDGIPVQEQASNESTHA